MISAMMIWVCMRRLLIALTAGVSLATSARLGADAEDLLHARLADYLESLRVQAGIPGLSAALVGRSDIVWERGFGLQNVEQALVMRTDTPVPIDGLTQSVTASLVLRCAEEGRLSLTDRVALFDSSSPDAELTLWQLLTHTGTPADSQAFAYRPDRLGPLASAVAACRNDTFFEIIKDLLIDHAMMDTIPGSDAVSVLPPVGGRPDPDTVRWAQALTRMATPYAVDQQRRSTPSSYPAAPLSAAGGLISTVRDLAQFDLSLKKGILLRPDTLALAWRPVTGPGGQRLPHGPGWFVQIYNGEPVAWQFGQVENASSVLMVTAPARGLTLILLANSVGLVKPFPMVAGDVTVSPFARVFLGLFVR